MLNRHIAPLGVLAVWAMVSLSHAHGQQLPPEPIEQYRTRSSTGCPDAADAQSQFKPLSEIKVGMQLEGEQVPTDCSVNVFLGVQEGGAMTASITEFHWAPANFFHQPLYFEDTPLERYGQSISPHWQPVISGGRFFLTFPIIPYKIGVDHPHDCVTNLGYYRPGICAPCVMQLPPPFQCSAGLLQAATTVGIVLLVP